jgi:hypothetical protein
MLLVNVIEKRRGERPVAMETHTHNAKRNVTSHEIDTKNRHLTIVAPMAMKSKIEKKAPRIFSSKNALFISD